NVPLPCNGRSDASTLSFSVPFGTRYAYLAILTSISTTYKLNYVKKGIQKNMKQAKNDNNSTYSMTHKNAIYVELHIYQ
ncbi:hypothetical protein, partial [Agathobacter sp.]|uniref:hypothetical protein n=1 Tax=Agathobacter sp. TaxID=2021311 RepID=UPI003AF0290C